MKYKDVPPIYTNHATASVFTDKSLILSFGNSPDGSDEKAEYHTAVYLPAGIVPKLMEMIQKAQDTVFDLNAPNAPQK